jgi:RNA polymerase sigma-70 factor (ECF subfamily)
MDLSDGQLMERVQAGDPHAFGEVVDRHKNGLVNYLSRLTGSRDRAEDLAQETFLRLLQARSRYQERGQLAAYIYRIATNLLRTEERRRRTWDFLQTRLFHWEIRRSREPPPGPTNLLVEELRLELQRCLQDLPLSFRAPLILREIEGWSYARIAQALGSREGTIKSRIHRAKSRLRQAMAPYWNGGGPS